MPIVQVLVNDEIRVRAALDSCSSSTFCTKALADDLALKGTQFPVVLDTLNGISSQTSHLVTMKIAGAAMSLF
jgi:hypothetical protein